MFKKRILSAVAFLGLAVAAAFAQNVQLHYDFGHMNDKLDARPSLTTTVEYFHPDKWGSTFFFVDMNYQDKGVESAYWEIVRELKFWKAPFSVHLEYDGGTSNHFSYADAYLLGGTYSWNAADFNAGFTVSAMYKYLTHVSARHSYQITATWYKNFCGGLLTTSGFADFWGARNFATGRGYEIFLAEPQLWLNFNKIKGVDKAFGLSLGTEWEISRNFVLQDNRWYWLPTLALKWTF